jgi:CRP-like cAMP-binding protein
LTLLHRTTPVTASSPSALATRLASFGAIAPEDMSRIGRALGETRRWGAHQDFVLSVEPHGARCWALESGWAGAASLLEDGRRQIVDLAMPGDIVDSWEVARFGLTLQALTDVRFRDATQLAELVAKAPLTGLAAAWRLGGDEVGARRVRHLVRLGGMLALERTADLLLELHRRQGRAGLGTQDRMDMPLTQEALSDYLGLSVVHLNRVLQHMRRGGMIDYGSGHITLMSHGRLNGALGGV